MGTNDEMEKELKKLQELREVMNKKWGDLPGFLANLQNSADVQEAQIRAQYGQLSPSEERAFYEKRDQELAKRRQEIEQTAIERGYPPSTYQDEIEEEQQYIRAKYLLPKPVSKPPQPSYTPPVFSSNDNDEWDKKNEDEDSDEWDEDEDEDEEYEEDENTDEEEYNEKPPAFISPPPSQPHAPEYQEPDRHQPAQGQSRLGRDIQTGKNVDVPQASRRQGLYIIGIQGTGKSVLIENLIIQDIKQNNIGVCVLDPHGDLINTVLSRLPDRRERDVIYLNITDYHYPFGINLFTCSDPTNPLEVQKIVDQVKHIFEKLLGVTQETQLILEYLYNCTCTLIANPGYTMADIPLLLQDEECRKNWLQT